MMKKDMNLMDRFILEGTSRTPTVVLDYQNKALAISGESYPENVTEFYGQLLTALERYFNEDTRQLAVTIQLDYFNSGSAHALLNLATKLNQKAVDGCEMSLVWACHDDDDISEEFAEDILSLVPQINMTIEKTS